MLSKKDFEFKKVVFIFLNHGEKMSFQNDNLIVKDKEGRVKHQSTCYRLFAVFVVGSFTVTTGLLQRAKRFAFNIVFMTHSFRVFAILPATAEGNTQLRRKQYLNERPGIAQWVVHNKIANQAHALKKARQHGDWAKSIIRKLENLSAKAVDCTDDKALLGIEGTAANQYFRQMYAEFNWIGRKPRVKHDINNCLLDIGYTLLFSLMEALLNCYGFDLYVGFYHKIFYQRKSLVCDLVEPFRCIVDYQIRKMNRLSMINPDDFRLIQGSYQLSYQKSAQYVAKILNEILEHKMEMFSYVQSFYRAVMKDKPVEQYPIFQYR